MIEDADYFVRLVDFPTNNGGMVILNPDGTYSVYINARLDDEHKKRAMRHEYDHMARNDIQSDRTIEEIERL